MIYMFGSGCFVFFFKQKTAYEMRISDWSSDVCSSDLGTAPATARASTATAGPYSGRRSTICSGGKDQWKSRDPTRNGLPSRSEGPEIGRASCRERVCQYV